MWWSNAVVTFCSILCIGVVPLDCSVWKSWNKLIWLSNLEMRVDLYFAFFTGDYNLHFYMLLSCVAVNVVSPGVEVPFLCWDGLCSFGILLSSLFYAIEIDSHNNPAYWGCFDQIWSNCYYHCRFGSILIQKKICRFGSISRVSNHSILVIFVYCG